MSYGPKPISPEYGSQFTHFEMTREKDYPISAHFLKLDGQKEEVIKTRILVGCDGARSKVRHSIGQKLSGQSTLQLWGLWTCLRLLIFQIFD